MDKTQAPPVEPGDAPEGLALATFAAGCFWGVEEFFLAIPGVVDAVSGYTGGARPQPTYEQVCSGATGHAEAVLVTFDPTKVSYEHLLEEFWRHHDPTTPNRQGGDVGTQYRSAVFTTNETQYTEAVMSRSRYQGKLRDKGFGIISTQIDRADEAGDGTFYYAEDYHQGYLHKNPRGYCNHWFCQVAY